MSHATHASTSRTTTIHSTDSWQASTSTLIPPSVSSFAPSIKSHFSNDGSIRSSALFPSLPRPSVPSFSSSTESYRSSESSSNSLALHPSPRKPSLSKPLPPIPQSEATEEDQLFHRNTVLSLPNTRHRPSTGASDPPPHPPDSQCSRAKREPDLPRLATLGKCTECGASKLHSVAAVGLNLSSENFALMVGRYQRDIKSRDRFGNTCLHAAAASKMGLDDFKVLHAAGADLLARNDRGELFLHLISAHHKNEFLIKLLEWAIEQNLDFKMPTYDGKTVLHTICERNMTQWALENMWPFLRSFGTAINVRDRWGKTAIDYLKVSLNAELSQSQQSSEPAQGWERLLVVNLPRYVSRLATDVVSNGETNAIMELLRDPEKCHQSDLAMWDVFRQSENDPPVQDHAGRNALHCLAYIIRFWDFNNRKCFEPLEARHEGVRSALRWKVDPNAYNQHGSTPLHCFLAYERFNDSETSLAKIIETLLENGADPLLRDRDGNTALHLACHHGRAECVGVLLRFLRNDARLHGQATRARNDKDRSPVKETLFWMNIHTTEEKELRLQCVHKVAGEEFTEAAVAHSSPNLFWGIPNSTQLSDAMMIQPTLLRPPTPMDICHHL